MNLKDLQKTIEAASTSFIDKGYAKPVGYIKVRTGGRFEIFCMAQMDERYDPDRTESVSVFADDIEKGIADFWSKMAEVKPISELRKDRFLSKMGGFIEEARELGLDDFEVDNGLHVDYVSILEGMMKKLSENALTHDKKLDAPE